MKMTARVWSWLLLLGLLVAVAAVQQEGSNGGEQPSVEISQDSSKGEDIPIEGLHDLVHGLVNGSLHSMPGNKDVAIALQNTNEVHKTGADADPEKEHRRHLDLIRKKSEAGLKDDMEERHKTTAEEVTKKTLMKKRDVSQEERKKKFDDELRAETFKHSKKAGEATNKANEEAKKQMQAVQREAQAAQQKLKRDTDVARAKMSASEATAKTKHQIAREAANEEVAKKDKEAKRKRDRAQRKFEQEARKKTAAEKKRKERASKQMERKRERHGKRMRRKMEQQAKANNRVQEQQMKQRHEKALGVWCNCRAQRVRFDLQNHWNICSGNGMLTGFYRGPHHNLANIYYFRCCDACKDDGRQVMKPESCQNANWVHSFDGRGWSHCPRHTYLKGLYKSTCNWLYCIEYAHCCRLHGSRGATECSHTNSWWGSLDRQGWSVAHGNKLITGLYRNTCHSLYCLEMADNCRFHAY